MPVNHKLKCIFVHIPKCAGTSVEAALGMHGALTTVGIEPYRKQSVNHATLFGAGAQHYTVSELKAALGAPCFQEYFKFALVRNPWDRVVSHFAWRLMWREDGLALSKKMFRVEILKLLLERVRRQPPHLHLRPQYTFIVGECGKIEVDYIGKIENLEKDWVRICGALAIDSPLDTRMRSMHKPYWEYYDWATRLIVHFLYRKDIALLGYRYRGETGP